MAENKDKVFSNTVINWYPGHMAKTKRLIVEKGNLIDIVYELVDARIPFSSKIKNIYDVVGDKPKIIIMTKKDLPVLALFLDLIISHIHLSISYTLTIFPNGVFTSVNPNS